MGDCAEFFSEVFMIGSSSSDGYRVYVGRLSTHAVEGDLWHLFADYRPRQVSLKNGYAFVEFKSSYTAMEALKNCNGVRICDSKISLEVARPRNSVRPRAPSYRDSKVYGISGISSRMNWRDLKNTVKKFGGIPVHVDCNDRHPGEGVIHFSDSSNARYCVGKMDNIRLEGRRIRLYPTDERIPFRRFSRSPPPKRRREYSRSRSRGKSMSRRMSIEKSDDSIVSQKSLKREKSIVSYDSYNHEKTKSISPVKETHIENNKDINENNNNKTINKSSNLSRYRNKARILLELEDYEDKFYSKHLSIAFSSAIFLNDLIIKVEGVVEDSI